MKYGRWTIIGPVINRRALCRCDCGTEKVVAVRTLAGRTASGKSTSCGCVRRELVAQKNFKHGDSLREQRTKEYRTWCHMLERCDNPNTERYPQYGGRGITVCSRWRGENGYANFLTDMGRAPTAQHSIERQNRDGNYQPDNCCWALPVIQANNTSRNVFVVYNSESMSVSQLARKLGVNRRYLSKLLHRGVSLEDALKRVSKNTSTNYKIGSAR